MEENTAINWKIVIPTLLNVLINLIISFSGNDVLFLCPAAAVIAVVLMLEYRRYPDKRGKNELLPYFFMAVLIKFVSVLISPPGFKGGIVPNAEIASMILVLAAAALHYLMTRKYDISYNKTLFAALTVNIAAISLYHEGVLMYVILGIPNAFL